jgi:UMF1 family MFS transporter
MTERKGLLERLALHRPELRAWAMYDWAISGMQTTVMVAIFPIFYIQVAGAEAGATAATQWWAISNGVATAIVAVLSPILGTIADFAAAKKKLLAITTGLGIVACAAIYFVQPGQLLLASVLFVLATIGAAAAVVFYDALLPHIASSGEVDRVSTAAYAIGYLGGGVLLALNLAMVLKPEWLGMDRLSATRLVMISVALWWLVFSLPLFRRVPEPPRRLEADEQVGQNPVRVAMVRLIETFRKLRAYKHAFLMLVAFLIYNDGITSVQRMAVAYGTELGIEQHSLIAAVLIVQFVGIPATFLFGSLAAAIGAKRSILAGLIVYAGVSVFAYSMTTAVHFYILAGILGLVQGGTQALSRSLFATLIPRHQSGEFFGFYSVFSKFAGIWGPFLFAGILGATGSSRNAILSVIVFFIIGGTILMFVNVDEGARSARAAEQATHEA